MTSKELHRQIAAFVADRLDSDEARARVRQSVRPCDDCGTTLTRDLVARIALSRSGRSDADETPSERALGNGTVEGSSGAVRRATDDHAPPPPKGIERIAGDIVSPAGITAALAVVALALVLLFGETGGQDESTLAVATAEESVPVDVRASQPQNLFNEAMRTFAQVASGQLGVQVPGEQRRDVEQYFERNGISYNVHFPVVSMPLVGGIVTRYGGRAFAQLVYSKDDRAVYVLVVPVDELREGTRLYVTQDVLARLERGEKLREVTPEGASLLMLRSGNIVVTAVANMEPAQLEQTIR